MEIPTLIISIIAIVISVIALVLQRQSEARNLRISFLLPELSEIIDSLRSHKVKNGKPDSESMTELYVKAKDICFKKEHILTSIGLGKQSQIIINAKDHSENKILTAYETLFESLDRKYQQLVGTNNTL